MYKASISEIRTNICDMIARKYVQQIIDGKDNIKDLEYKYYFVRAVFRYLLITKGNIHKARREEYLNHGVKPTDKFIKYCGFQGDYTGCITYMKNIFEVESMKEELFDGISMGKVIYHIMRIVYLNPSFIDIVENQMKIKQKGYGKH